MISISPVHTCNNMTTIIYLVCLFCLFLLSVSKMKMIYFLFHFLNYNHVVINFEELDHKSQKGKGSRVGNSLSLNLVSRLKNRDILMTQKVVDQINYQAKVYRGVRACS